MRGVRVIGHPRLFVDRRAEALDRPGQPAREPGGLNGGAFLIPEASNRASNVDPLSRLAGVQKLMVIF